MVLGISPGSSGWVSISHRSYGTGEVVGALWNDESTCPLPGNEALHSLTSSGDYSLRVDLRAGDEAVFAHYDSFRVDSAAKYYQLHLEGYHGTAGEGRGWEGWGLRDGWEVWEGRPSLFISCPAQGTP